LDAVHTAYIKLSEHTKENLPPYTHPDGEPESLLKRNPQPTSQPTTTNPSNSPSQSPPSTTPSQSPSSTPSTDEPTNFPTTELPTHLPTISSPSRRPNLSPSPEPTPEPTSAPTTDDPSLNPSISNPSWTPSKAPSTDTPTFTPSAYIPPYPYRIDRWAHVGDKALCEFESNDYRIGFGSYSSVSACKRSCENDARCVSFELRTNSYCELYKYIPSYTSTYSHGGKFACWVYDGGKGVQPQYHWMGWGDCFTDSGSSMFPFRTITGFTAPSLESCIQHCRNANCLSVTWSHRDARCGLHQQYAARSRYRKDKDYEYEQCYNILYNYEL